MALTSVSHTKNNPGQFHLCLCLGCEEIGTFQSGASLTREDYARYIASAQWHNNAARLSELEAAGYRCRACDRCPPEVRLEVHHRTYVRLGRELARDLTTLCADCHLAITDDHRRRRHAQASLPSLRDSWTCLPVRRLAISEWIDAGRK